MGPGATATPTHHCSIESSDKSPEQKILGSRLSTYMMGRREQGSLDPSYEWYQSQLES